MPALAALPPPAEKQVAPMVNGSIGDTPAPSRQPGNEGVNVDREVVCDWMLEHLGQALVRPPTTASFITSNGMSVWSGQSLFF